MKKLSVVLLGLPVVAVAGGLTVIGRKDVHAASPETARVAVPAGTFLMGSETGAPDERPVHRVSGAAFALDRYEVTNARYAACVQAGACTPPALL
jgi:formylglycine-generating enzyme required for sulfatase activity